MIRRLLASGLLLAALLLPQLAAAAVPIQPSPTVLLGDGSVASNFTCTITMSGGGFGGPTDCGAISVTGTPGLLTFNSGFAAANGHIQDVFLTYEITSPTAITGIDLSFNGAFMGQAINNVVEQVFNSANALLGTLSVGCSGACVYQDPPLGGFLPLIGGGDTHLIVHKDILLAADLSSFSTISMIGQSFHIPEPAPLLVLGGSFVALGMLTRRRWGGGTLGCAANDDSHRMAA